METVEIKSSAWALASALFSSAVGWITVATAKETIMVAIISTLIGYFVGKLLSFIEKKISRKKDKKA